MPRCNDVDGGPLTELPLRVTPAGDDREETMGSSDDPRQAATRTGQIADLPDVLSVADLAAILRIGESTAYRLIAERRIRALRLGRRIVVPKASLVALLEPKEDRRR